MTKPQPASETAAVAAEGEQEWRESTWNFNGIQGQKDHIKMFLTHCWGEQDGVWGSVSLWPELPAPCRTGEWLGWHLGMFHSLSCHLLLCPRATSIGTGALVLSTKWHLLAALPCPPSSSMSNWCTGTPAAGPICALAPCRRHSSSTGMQFTALAGQHQPEPVTVPGSSPLPFLQPFHLTKYLHEMAIRLPGFNEN